MSAAHAVSAVVVLSMLTGGGGALATGPTASAAAPAPTSIARPAAALADISGPDVPAAEAAERLLRADADGPVTVRHGADGLAEFVGTVDEPVAPDAAAPDDAAADGPTRPAPAARAHLDRYGALFGVPEPGQQLDTTEILDATGGGHVVRFQQQVGGVPVLGGEISVAVDADGDLESVTGETATGAPTAGADTPAPAVAPASARETALAVTTRTHRVPAATLHVGEPTEWLYDPELLGAPDVRGARTVWRVEVGNGFDIRELVLVDAATGRVAAHVNQVAHALDRVVCNANGPLTRHDESCTRGHYVRTESRDATSVADADDAFRYAGDTAALFDDLGVDLTAMIGYDAGDGPKLRSTVRYCPDRHDCPMRNAFWNGYEMYYGKGFAGADDVVAHELTHGVVQHTANLFYWHQSGAINESMADVFGEIVDQRNGRDRAGEPQRRWLLGEDLPVGAIRDMKRPGRLGQPDRMRSRRYAQDRNPLFGDNGGVHTNSGVGNKAAYLIAQGGRFNGRTVRGLDTDRRDRLTTARVYYAALQRLTSGSDYADLARVLPQACRSLVGTGGVGARDCVQVRNAVRATQMHRQPRVAAAPEARRCPSGTGLSKRRFFDDMERARTRNWRFGQLWSRSPHAHRGLPEYATSGRRSLFGFDPAPELGDPRHSNLVLDRTFTVRSGSRTFVRFDHSYLFEFARRRGSVRHIDGGRLEYSTSRGRSWRNAARLPWINGPRQQVTLGTGRTRFRGFGGDSHGYRSSRVELTGLAGRTVRLRWRVSGDEEGGYLGWWLDDVEVFGCGTRTASAPRGLTVRGSGRSATVRWQRPGWTGTRIRGYRVSRTPGSIRRLPADARSARFTGLRRGQRYTFRVRAVNGAGAPGPRAVRRFVVD